MTAWKANGIDTNYLVPPAVGAPYTGPQLASGTVMLFKDGAWSSNAVAVNTSSYVSNVLTGLPSNARGCATWLAFNLPLGVVVTLTSNFAAASAGQPVNFAGADVCVDLIGNGQVQTVDLGLVGANDKISAFIWRQVDLKAGVFQLFADTGCSGIGNTFFLSEWPLDATFSLNGWCMADQASSAYVGGLGVGIVTLAENPDGTGRRCVFNAWLAGLSGPNGKSIDLGERGFMDCLSAWNWTPQLPVHQDVVIKGRKVSMDTAKGATLSQKGRNSGTQTVTQTANFSYSQTQSCTVSLSTTSTYTYTESASFSMNYGEASGEVGFEASQEFQTSMGKETTNSETITLTVQQDFDVEAGYDWDAQIQLHYGSFPATRFNASGTYYYEIQVPNSVPDPAMATQLGYPMLYRLNADLTYMISAGFGVQSEATITTTPIPVAPAAGATPALPLPSIATTAVAQPKPVLA
jgi:hypothetical protein